MKTVSVVIPTFNRANYIKPAIDSVINQKVPKGYQIEVIVIDDGSTDNTEDIVKAYGRRVKYERIENSGCPAIPRNIGINMAKGDLIAFQDSDDLWTENKLFEQLPVFEDPLVVLSYGNASIITETGKKTGGTVIPAGSGKSGYIFKDLLIVNLISTLTVIARKSVILQAGGFDESVDLRGVEDYHLWLRVSRLGKFKFIDMPLALYRRHNQNISLSVKHDENQHIFAVLKSLLKYDLSHSEKRLLHQQMANLYIEKSKNLSGVFALFNLFRISVERLLSRL